MERCTYDKNKGGPLIEIDLYSDACAFSLPNTASALLTDLILLEEQEGSRSGLCGSVLDMSDSNQNNKRAAEMSSFAVADALLEHMPGALGTAVHVIVAATHRTTFADDHNSSPMARISKAAFVFTLMTFHTIAHVHGHDADRYSPPVSRFGHTVAVHGYTAPTRWALMLALPSLVGLFHLQRLDFKQQALDAAVPVAPQQLGSQHCESLFSTWRSASGQNTGSISCSEALAKADTAITLADMEAPGTFSLPASRKAAKHK
jgi:hypothetical protein